MYQHETPSNITTSRPKLSEHGRTPEKSSTPLPKGDIEDTSSKTSKVSVVSASSSTVVSQAKNKPLNFSIKSNIFERNIRRTNLSAISDQELAQKGKASKPFWNASSQEISKKLLSHQQTAFQDLDLNYLNGCFRSSREKLQASLQNPKIWPQTFSKLSQSSHPDSTGGVVIRARKIQFHPTNIQVKKINKFFGCYRLFYNKAAEFIDNNDTYKESFKIPTAIDIRRKLLTDPTDEAWIRKKDKSLATASYDIADEAIRVCIGNYNTGKIIHFKKYMPDAAYRVSIKLHKKDTKQACNLTKNNYKCFLEYMRILPKSLGSDSFFEFDSSKKSTRDIIEMMNCVHGKEKKFGTIKLIRDEYLRYYFCITYEVPVVDRNIANNNMVAFDPGYRTFITCSDSHGNRYSIGNDMIEKVKSMGRRIKYVSETRNGKRKVKSLRTKVTHYVEDYHCKVAKFLATKYRNVVAPELSSKFIKKHKGVMYKKYVDFISHYKFTSKLKLACEGFGVNYLFTNESYTSLTCCHCGHVNDKYIVKTLSCKKCGVDIDRDINGANNIFTRFITRKV